MRGSYGENGTFIPETTDCTQQGYCRYPEPYQDTHHLMYPRSEFRTAAERAYRNLGRFCIEICRCAHEEIHATTSPPDKPEYDEMMEALSETEQHLSSRVQRQVERWKSQD